MTTTHATAAPADAPDAAARKALVASAVGYAMDGFDLLILGFMLRAISADLHLTPPQAGSLVTWTLVGAVAGGILFGMLADYYGRVRVLTWTILLFAVFTGLCALAQGYWDLLMYRTIAGLGLGGEFGIGMALVAEAWPAEQRARACSYVALGWQAGVLCAALVTPLLLPSIGWRGMFVVGLIPGVVAFAVRWYVGEPKIFTERVAKPRTMAPLRMLVKDAATTQGQPRHVHPLLGAELRLLRRDDLAAELPVDAVRLRADAVGAVDRGDDLGMAFGIWVFGVFADKVGRRPALLTFQAGAFVMVLIYSQLTDATALLIGGAVMGMFVNGMLGGYGALLSELYPTEARATAENVLFNLGRGVGGFGPFVVGALAVSYSFTVAIALLATIYLIDIVATLRLFPNARASRWNKLSGGRHNPAAGYAKLPLRHSRSGGVFVMRILRPLAAAVAAVCSLHAGLRQIAHRNRQVGAAHDRLAGRRAALRLGGVDRTARLRHAGRRVHAVPHGEGPLQPRVGRRADAEFDLLHQARPRHPRHRARPQHRPAGVARLRAARAGECARLFGLVKQEGMANVRVVLSGATGPRFAGDGAPRAAQHDPPAYDDDDHRAAPARRVYRVPWDRTHTMTPTSAAPTASAVLPGPRY